MRQIPTMQDNVTSLSADYFNELPEELQNAIISSGQVLTNQDGTNPNLFQLAMAIAVYVAGGMCYSDSGNQNAYSLIPIGSKKAPPFYFNGMKVSFFISQPNSGPSTVNVNGLGVKTILDPEGNALIKNELNNYCLLYTSPSPRDGLLSRMPSSA